VLNSLKLATLELELAVMVCRHSCTDTSKDMAGRACKIPFLLFAAKLFGLASAEMHGGGWSAASEPPSSVLQHVAVLRCHAKHRCTIRAHEIDSLVELVDIALRLRVLSKNIALFALADIAVATPLITSACADRNFASETVRASIGFGATVQVREIGSSLCIAARLACCRSCETCSLAV
jgi:hypothetical protein